MLNAREIEKENLIVLDNAKGKFAQVGYDLSIKSISKLKGGGKVLKDKTIVNQLSEVNFNEADNGWWLDPGFSTDNIGTVMNVHERIFIEQDARIAQMYFHENSEGELYDGQFQNDKQRK